MGFFLSCEATRASRDGGPSRGAPDGFARGGQDPLVLGPHLVVRIRIDPEDPPARGDQEHTRYGQLSMTLPRGLTEVDTEALVPAPGVLIELKGDAECASSLESTVGVQGIPEPLGLTALDQLFRPIRADRDDRKPERGQLVLDFTQLPELRIAIGSPTAAIEDEQRTAIPHERRDVDPRTFDRTHHRARHIRSHGEGPNGLRIGIHRVRLDGDRICTGERGPGSEDGRPCREAEGQEERSKRSGSAGRLG